MNASSSPRTRGLAVGAIATLVLLLMLPNVLWLWLGTGTNMWRDALVIPAVLLFTLFALFGNRQWIACLLLAPFATLAPLEAFYIFTYHRPTFAEIIATLVATNPREMREYLGVTLLPTVLCVIAALLVALLAAWWSRRTPLQWRRGIRAWLLTLGTTALLGTGIVAGVTAKGDFSKRLHAGTQKVSSLGSAIQYGYPFGLIQRIVDYRNEWNAMRENFIGKCE